MPNMNDCEIRIETLKKQGEAESNGNL